MKPILVLALAGIFALLLPGPVRAQKAAEPPAIPPMLEGNRPLAQAESREPEGPAAEEPKGDKTKTGAVRSGRSDSSGKISHKKKAKKKKATKRKKRKSSSAQEPQPNSLNQHVNLLPGG